MDTVPGALALTEGMYIRINGLEDDGVLDTVEAERMKGVLARHLPADRETGLCRNCGVEWMCPPVRAVSERIFP